MSVRIFMLIVVTSLSVGLTELVGLADEKSAPAPEAKPTKRNVPGERLPRNWAALELSDDQKEAIYAINRRAKTSLESAEAEVERLRSEMTRARDQLNQARRRVDDERIAVLTDAQKAKLAEIREKARARQSTKSAGSTSRETKQPGKTDQ